MDASSAAPGARRSAHYGHSAPRNTAGPLGRTPCLGRMTFGSAVWFIGALLLSGLMWTGLINLAVSAL